MAILTSEDLTLEIKIRDVHDWGAQDTFEINYEFTMKWHEETVMNDATLKHGNYWGNEGSGSFVASDDGKFYLLRTMQVALETGERKNWASFPDPDAQVAILPNVYDFIDDSIDIDYCTIIVAPDTYQFKDCKCYCGANGVFFVMTVTKTEFAKFIDDFSNECAKIELPERLRKNK